MAFIEPEDSTLKLNVGWQMADNRRVIALVDLNHQMLEGYRVCLQDYSKCHRKQSSEDSCPHKMISPLKLVCLLKAGCDLKCFRKANEAQHGLQVVPKGRDLGFCLFAGLSKCISAVDYQEAYLIEYAMNVTAEKKKDC